MTTPERQFLGALLLIALAGVVFRTLEGAPPLTPEGGAAWAQAIMSVIGIGAIGYFQDRERRKERQTIGAQELETLFLSAVHLDNIVRTAANNAVNGTWNVGYVSHKRRELQAEMDALNGIDVARLPNRHAALQLRRSRMSILHMHTLVDATELDLSQGQLPSTTRFNVPRNIVAETLETLTQMVPPEG